MSLVTNGFLQDTLKLAVYVTPLVYLINRKKELGLRYFWVFYTGLSLLVFGHLIDLLDEFAKDADTSRFSAYYEIFDFFEDTIGLTLGFAVFAIALYLEHKSSRAR